MHPNRTSGFVGLIFRPKLLGPGRHVGVMLSDGNVAHKQPAGVSIDSLETFLQGREPEFGERVPESMHVYLLWRAYESVGRTLPYDLLNRNCEHYATWLLKGKAESAQINGAVLLGLLAVLVFASR